MRLLVVGDLLVELADVLFHTCMSTRTAWHCGEFGVGEKPLRAPDCSPDHAWRDKISASCGPRWPLVASPDSTPTWHLPLRAPLWEPDRSILILVTHSYPTYHFAPYSSDAVCLAYVG
jgi:hypothetical protein